MRVGSVRSWLEPVIVHLVRGTASPGSTAVGNSPEWPEEVDSVPTPPQTHLRAGIPKGSISTWRSSALECLVAPDHWKKVSDSFFITVL